MKHDAEVIAACEVRGGELSLCKMLRGTAWSFFVFVEDDGNKYAVEFNNLIDAVERFNEYVKDRVLLV